jgi:hypothetical protein
MASKSGPVFARLEITLVGPHDLIERQVRDLTDEMTAEVASRASRRAAAPPPPDAAISADYFAFIGERGVGMANEVALLGAAIERSALPSGSPALFVQNYARLLDCVLSARDDIRARTMPAAFETPAAWDGFANGVYDQIAAWPEQMRVAAERNAAQRLRLALVSEQSIAPIERATAADTRHLETQNAAIERQTALLGQNKGCATVVVTVLAAFVR